MSDSKAVLVVDDEPNMINLIREILTPEGYHVFSAMDALQGLMTAQRERPGLIILDVNMPAGGGLALYERLKVSSLTEPIPVLFLTGTAKSDIRDKIEKLPNSLLMFKPFNPSALLEKVQKLI
ncbi:MAG: response regulator [Elusimicrobia bacterium]|nr:response regulator [Elusimicrobiota bacterium]